MPSFPTLHSGGVAHYNTEITANYQTRIHRFVSDAQQRWKGGNTIITGALRFEGIDGYDLARIREFFNSQKGRFASNWDITIDSTLYENMTFEQEEITDIEPESPDGRFDLELKVKQTK